MTYNVVILKSARYEYESIVGYLAQILKNPRTAGNFVAEFEYQLDPVSYTHLRAHET